MERSSSAVPVTAASLPLERCGDPHRHHHPAPCSEPGSACSDKYLPPLLPYIVQCVLSCFLRAQELFVIPAGVLSSLTHTNCATFTLRLCRDSNPSHLFFKQTQFKATTDFLCLKTLIFPYKEMHNCRLSLNRRWELSSVGRVAPCRIQTLTQTLISILPIFAELLFYQENFKRVHFSIFFFSERVSKLMSFS